MGENRDKIPTIMGMGVVCMALKESEMSQRLSSVVVCAACLTVSAGSALAFVPWTNDTGSTSWFDWSNGGSDNGLFGDPQIVGDTFVFFPSGFRAESVNGMPDIVDDRLQFELIVHPGFRFDAIEITEIGDYGIFDTGTVSVSGSLFVTDLNVFRVATDDMVTTPGSPITSGSGSWTGSVGVDLTKDPPDWTRIMVVLDNNLIALSVGGSTTFIEKKVTGAAVVIGIVPEPGTLALVGLGAFGMFRRRR